MTRSRRAAATRIVSVALATTLAAGCGSGTRSAPGEGPDPTGPTTTRSAADGSEAPTGATTTTTPLDAAPPSSGGARPAVAPTMTAPEVPVPIDDAPAGRITLVVRGPDGAELGYDAFTEIRTAGTGDDGINDVLVDPATLVVQVVAPLYDDGGAIALDRPAGPTALAVAWPTSRGYSNLIIDLPAPGTHSFNLLAARQAVADARRWNAAAPAGGEFETLLAEAERELATAEAASEPVAAAAAADRALDLAVRGALLPRWPRRAGAGLVKGVTIDRPDVDPALWPTVVAMAGDREPWARLVFDLEQPPESYRAAVDAAHAAGVRVLGQFLDSSDMAAVTPAEYEARVRAYLAALPDLDMWEVGNEINGNWLGPDAGAKAAAAARLVKATTGTRTMLTLYWQLGEDTAEASMFTWLDAELSPEFLADLDEVSVSIWVEEHPMGAAFDRVFATLAARLPGVRLLVGELGYGNDDLELRWWWGDPDDPTGAARAAVAADLFGAALDRPWLAGGYWWYYEADAYPVNALWDVLAAA